MPRTSDPKNPVMDLLARSSAPTLVGGTLLPEASARPFVAQYGVGRPGSGKTTGAMVPLIIGAGLVLLSLIVAISALRNGGVTMNSGMGIGLPLVIAAFIAGPALFRAKDGTRQWRRTAQIFADRVEVTDTAGSVTATWTAPISEYTDVHQSYVWLSSPDGDGDGLELEVILLRHPDPAKTIYVSGTRKVILGNMSFSDMVKAGREGRKDDVVAAAGDTRNLQVEALVDALTKETGLSLVQDFGA
ncbi:hypothetical protein KUL25_02265 [Rhodobacteraceae bacterium N5(2021)]|uniref:Uncharacterized protein n=1 Tax=Gymnodinialimonas phycosphaerae TaxID=2841589 RepID=A0A975YGF1_9RHOB|nr:hypothetical protein [Gymnodinialimonas phycosphaerae]MBY4891586.1 hypothetical protein [Gymnodinialimonas phycosphaerae]